MGRGVDSNFFSSSSEPTNTRTSSTFTNMDHINFIKYLPKTLTDFINFLMRRGRLESMNLEKPGMDNGNPWSLAHV